MSGLETASPGNRAIEEQSSQSSKGSVVDAPTADLSIEELRTMNRIQSPLLRLPCETLIYILLFTIDDTKRTPNWTAILPACHYLYQTILSTPQLWERIYCLPPEKMLRRFEMANWRPTEIYAHLFTSNGEEKVKAALNSVRDAGQLRRDRIHTLEFRGVNDVWPHFSWIFNEPFPNLEHLTVFVVMSPGSPIPLTVSVGKHLETLSIDNVNIPASSHLFHNLKNLHVGFSQDCNRWPVTIHQLIAILNASPRLESLSLGHICLSTSLHDDEQPKCVATLSHLRSITLMCPASDAVSIMGRLDLPSITYLTLHLSGLRPSHIRLIFPDDILTNRLSKVTPNFPHFTQSGMLRMGGLQLTVGATEHREEIFFQMCRMVPISVKELGIILDMFNESRWREFARQRPEVCSISSYYDVKNYRSNGLWCALLPDKSNPSATLFPNLESVTLKAEHLSMIPPLVLDCLRMRSEAGFKLKQLEVQDTGKLRHAGRQPGDFQALSDVFVYCEVPIKLQE